MNTYTYNQPNLTLVGSNLQLKLNINFDFCMQDDGKVQLIRNIVERMDLKKLQEAYSEMGRKPTVNPIIMLQILLLCYSEGIHSARKIESSCRYDLRIRYLLDGQKAPDHVTINRYRNKLEPIISDLMFQFTEMLLSEGHVDLSSIYIDGTKVEAYANKYSFVWKKSILKNQRRLKEKIIQYFQLPIFTTLEDLKKILKNEINLILNKVDTHTFIHGRGKRKTQLQRDYEQYTHWLSKLCEYQIHLEIMGERNSYSKTDHDATFMRMKDDHMRNGQLKPGYNIQFASAGQFIIGAYGSHHTNDVYTLPLFMDKLYPRYKNYLKRIVCDSGYESIENYIYLKEKSLAPYIKPLNYEKAKTKKYQRDISLRDNMIYHKEEDYYECAFGKKLLRQKDYYKKRKSGYIEKNQVYKCFECNMCPYQKECNKYSKKENPQTKSIYFNSEFNRLRKESYENITSFDGITERLNRSIQAEGVFSKLKEGMRYNRFRHRGLNNVMCDIQLQAIAININTLFNKLIKNQVGNIKYQKVS